MSSLGNYINEINADFVGFKKELVFTHVLDDTVIKILYLGYDTFVWLQYGPNEGSSQDLEVVKKYTEKELRPIVEQLSPYNNNITALELFNEFLKTVKL